MSFNIPGGFPTNSEKTNFLESKAPTAADFHFTPLANQGPLYPNLDNYNTDLNKECQKLGYSNKLSTNVLQELDKRAATKISMTSYASKKAALSPRSSRYNASHRSRFTKMDSISSHYAARKANSRHEIEIEKENIPSYDPNSKRNNVSILSSVTKRRKTELGAKEVQPSLSPSKKFTNLSGILQGANSTVDRTKGFQNPATKSRLPQSPSKSSLRQPVTTSHTLSSSISTITLNKKPSMSNIPTLASSANISKLTAAKKLPKSATLGNLTKPTASSLSKSTSTRTLRPMESKESLIGIPTSKPIHNSRMSSTRKPVWR